MSRALHKKFDYHTNCCTRRTNKKIRKILIKIDKKTLTTITRIYRNIYRDFNWCKPRNILFDISLILFSTNCRSRIREAPSKALSSIVTMWLRLSSSLTKWGKRPNNPSDLMRVNSLSLSRLRMYSNNWEIILALALKKSLKDNYSSVVRSGISRGISLRPRPEQSTMVPSHWHSVGHSVSIRHSPESFIRISSHEPEI